jgi:predicted Zn-dependent protease with MMP-like domain
MADKRLSSAPSPAGNTPDKNEMSMTSTNADHDDVEGTSASLNAKKKVNSSQLHEWRNIVETAVEEAIEELRNLLLGHPYLARELEKLTFSVADDAPSDEPDLLGLYQGVTTAGDDSFQLPPLVELFVLPLIDIATPEETSSPTPDLQRLCEEVRITVRHEIAHHFGMDHDKLEELGLS